MMYEQQQQQVRLDWRRKTGTADQRKGGSAIIEEDESLEVVDLSGLSMESLPNPTLNLALVCKLDLSNNNLQTIPESLTARLLNVVVLDVHSNQLKVLPNSIGCLSKLKVLNVAGNYLRFLPRTIENCRSLEELNANFNQLTRLPDTIGFELLNLKKLSISSNKLVFLPHSISHLTSLRILDARLNCLHSLPEDMENLINLEVLNLSQNFQCLETLPYSIGLLLSLVELDVSYNKITALPDSMGCLKKLQKLYVEGNPLTSPPPEVVEQGLHAVREYLSDKMNAGHQSPVKKKSWISKLVRYGTFNGSQVSRMNQEEREGFMAIDYQRIAGLASPRYVGRFSPRRLFSPRRSH
ncbi:plant intracellular Ras-group-related LRR protein 6-like [Rhodamnia argentea]|uniref:Plant intracellular Ras-group-related LRR protein 6-like n=1 Tax=Rhodamnia argentea TaxID=178133 RepID=A0A8B8PLU0_9MYRT|nr:plant intracellular Ras-group-related LRR protein 6-like [Rhodamnia argentea]